MDPNCALSAFTVLPLGAAWFRGYRSAGFIGVFVCPGSRVGVCE